MPGLGGQFGPARRLRADAGRVCRFRRLADPPCVRPGAGGWRAATGGLAIGIVAAASPVHSSGFGAAVSTGPPVRLAPAPATLPLVEMVARLNAAAPPALLGYPAKLAELARAKLAGRLTIAPRSVTSIAELLTPADRAVIEQGFGVPVIDSFVSTEGLAGHSEPGGTVLSFASDLCLAELVDEANNPVPAGVTSAKVLVTNLHNLTQPLIRDELTRPRFTRPAGARHPAGCAPASREGPTKYSNTPAGASTRTLSAALCPVRAQSVNIRSGGPAPASTLPASLAAAWMAKRSPPGSGAPCARPGSPARR